jgi:hypothetical protein
MQLRPSAVACVLAAALCPAPFVNAQTNDGAALTLDEALLLARSNNRDLKQFGLDVGKQQETLGEAKTHSYPVRHVCSCGPIISPVARNFRAEG